MKSYTSTKPSFSNKIKVTEPTDRAHADNINAAPKQLLENTLVLASVLGGMLDVAVTDGTLRLPVALDAQFSRGTMEFPEKAAIFNDEDSEMEISSQTVIGQLQGVRNCITGKN